MEEAAGAFLGIVIILIVVFVGIVLPIISAIWAMNDAEKRGKSGCLVAILVFFFWPLGLILWLIFRPNDRW